MNYTIYKFEFQTAVRFGSGNLESGELTFCADTLFSALCQEACKVDLKLLHQFVDRAKNGKILFSDAFPYMGKTFFLPKPMKRINREFETASSVLKKAYKKLKYIPVEEYEHYLKGEYDVLKAQNLNKLGAFETKVSVSLRGNDQPEPYRVGHYYFNNHNGLYIICAFDTAEDANLIEQLLLQLSYSGIGGKRSSGYGRFILKKDTLHPNIEKRLKHSGSQYMTLSVSLPKQEEIHSAIENAEYMLTKRSGFVASDTYAGEQQRKRDLYVFKTGSCFQRKYSGDVFDVSHKFGKHPVYRYAKPLFMEVDT